MAIFKSIKSGIKKLATGVYRGLNSAGNSLSNALSGSTNTASAGMAFPVGQGLSPQQANRATNIVKSGGSASGGASGSWEQAPTSSTNLMTSNPSGSAYTAAIPTSYSSLMTPTPSGGGYSRGSSYPTIGGGQSNAFIQMPVNKSVSADTLGAGTQSFSSLGAVGGATGTGGGSPGTSSIGNNIALGAGTNGMFANGTTVDAQGNTVRVENTESKKDKTQMDYMKEIAGIRPEEPSSASIREKANNEAGLQQARQQMQNTQNAINGITNQLNQNLLQLRGVAANEGVTEAVYGGQQAQLQREATIKLLPLQSQLAVDQGNLELAKSIADDLFKSRYEDATRKSDNWYKDYEMAKDMFTADEKKKIDAIKQAHDDNKSVLTNRTAMIQDLVNMAYESGNSVLGGKIMKELNNLPNVDSANFTQDLNAVMSNVTRVAGNLASLQAQKFAQENAPQARGTYNTQQEKVIDNINTGVSNSFNYKAVNSAKGFADGVLASLNQKNGLSDIAAINQFQKVIDEGAVTREQDVNLVRGAQSLVNSLKTKVKKLEKGDQLGDKQRVEMANTVQALYEAKLRSLNDDPYVKAQVDKAKRSGIDVADTILGNLGSFEKTQSSSNQTVKSNGQDYVVGKVYNDGTANWVVDAQGNWSKQ